MTAPTPTPTRTPTRWAWAEVDLDAIAHNVELLRARVLPADVWAVVKANGYGHGAIDVARVALDAGASGLCVALVAEGVELRQAGIDAPILLLSQQPPEAFETIVDHDLIATGYTVEWLSAFASVAESKGATGVPVHLKFDTGMQRVGAPPDRIGDLLGVFEAATPTLRLDGIFTHLAIADDPDADAVALQLDRLDAILDEASRLDPNAASVTVHAANSAGALAHPAARRAFVRAGIAIYGISPGPGVDVHSRDLRPALSLHARVSHVKRVAAGSRISYGLRHTFERDTTVATLPIGYADGVPRRLGLVGGEVLVAGRRRPIRGVVTMDQLMVDLGDDDVPVGEPAVLIGSQGAEQIRAEEWAGRLDTIGYEIVCGISARVERLAGRSIVG